MLFVCLCVYVCVALQTACNRPQKAGQPVPTVCFCRHCSCNPANNSLIFLYHFLDFKIPPCGVDPHKLRQHMTEFHDFVMARIFIFIFLLFCPSFSSF